MLRLHFAANPRRAEARLASAVSGEWRELWCSVRLSRDGDDKRYRVHACGPEYTYDELAKLPRTAAHPMEKVYADARLISAVPRFVAALREIGCSPHSRFCATEVARLVITLQGKEWEPDCDCHVATANVALEAAGIR